MIKRVLCIVGLLVFTSLSVQAGEICFVAKEDGKIVCQQGQCQSRFSPFSTFKVALAVMGFDAGILITPGEPEVEFTEERKKVVAPWHLPGKYPIHRLSERSHTPQTWIQISVIWYSQYITQALGVEKLQTYVNQFDYGNKDVSGEPGKKNGLQGAWIRSSLQISPLEHLTFIEKLANRDLPVSPQAQENTIKIIKLETILDGWQLYGKTGGSMEFGWFVGWIEKGGRRISFVQCIEQPKDSLISGGRMAKEIAKDNLTKFLFAKTSKAA